jgi:hypothetical protein
MKRAKLRRQHILKRAAPVLPRSTPRIASVLHTVLLPVLPPCCPCCIACRPPPLYPPAGSTPAWVQHAPLRRAARKYVEIGALPPAPSIFVSIFCLPLSGLPGMMGGGLNIRCPMYYVNVNAHFWRHVAPMSRLGRVCEVKIWMARRTVHRQDTTGSAAS